MPHGNVNFAEFFFLFSFDAFGQISFDWQFHDSMRFRTCLGICFYSLQFFVLQKMIILVGDLICVGYNSNHAVFGGWFFSAIEKHFFLKEKVWYWCPLSGQFDSFTNKDFGYSTPPSSPLVNEDGTPQYITINELTILFMAEAN